MSNEQMSLFPELESHFKARKKGSDDNRLSFEKKSGFFDYLKSKIFNDNYKFKISDKELKDESVWTYHVRFYSEKEDVNGTSSAPCDFVEVSLEGASLPRDTKGNISFDQNDFSSLLSLHANNKDDKYRFDNINLRRACNTFSEEGDGIISMLTIEDQFGKSVKINNDSSKLFNKQETSLSFSKSLSSNQFEHMSIPYINKAGGLFAISSSASIIDSISNKIGGHDIAWPALKSAWSFVEQGALYLTDHVSLSVSFLTASNDSLLSGNLSSLNPVIVNIGQSFNDAINFVNFSAPIENVGLTAVAALVVGFAYEAGKLALKNHKELSDIKENVDNIDCDTICSVIPSI